MRKNSKLLFIVSLGASLAMASCGSNLQENIQANSISSIANADFNSSVDEEEVSVIDEEEVDIDADSNSPILKLDSDLECENIDAENDETNNQLAQNEGSLNRGKNRANAVIGDRNSDCKITAATIVYGLSDDGGCKSVDLAFKASNADGILCWWEEGVADSNVFAPTDVQGQTVIIENEDGTSESYCKIKGNYDDTSKKKGYMSLDTLNRVHTSLSGTYEGYFSMGEWMHSYRFTDYVYARAYKITKSIGDDNKASYTINYSTTVVKYSILTYIYNMSSSTNTKTQEYIAGIKESGASAQDEYNNNTGYNTDRKPDSTYYKVKLSSGKLSDGFSSGLYNLDETIELKSGTEFWDEHTKNLRGSNNGIPMNTIVGTYDSSNGYYTIACNNDSNFCNQGLNIIDGVLVSCDSSITEVTVPSEITIGESAFSNCTSLQKINYNGYHYVISNGEATFISYDGSESSITIPDLIGNIEITSVGDGTKCVLNSSVTAIDIGDNVERINANSFKESSISSIELPKNVSTIGSYAFSGCTALASVNIPSGVTSIADYTFYNCSTLDSITLPDNLTLITIGAHAFDSCTKLSNDIFKNLIKNVRSLGEYAFNWCTALTSIEIPSQVTSISNYCFANDTNLSNITWNEGLQSIGEHAFDNSGWNASLDSITSNFPTTLTSIGSYAFGNFANSQTTYNITLSTNITFIGDNAFSNTGFVKSTINVAYGGTTTQYKTLVGDKEIFYMNNTASNGEPGAACVDKVTVNVTCSDGTLTYTTTTSSDSSNVSGTGSGTTVVPGGTGSGTVVLPGGGVGKHPLVP